MSLTNIPSAEAVQPLSHFTAEINSRSGHATYDAISGGLIGFDAGFFGSMLLTEEMSTNFMYGGAGATALGVVAGAISYIRRR